MFLTIEEQQRELKRLKLMNADAPAIVTNVDYVLSSAATFRRPYVMQSAFNYEVNREFDYSLFMDIESVEQWEKKPLVFRAMPT